jgi:hypothetical protein
MPTKCWLENLKRRSENMEGLGIDWRVILKETLKIE